MHPTSSPPTIPARPPREPAPLLAAKQVVRGALMGSADLVPGVSGGTVALVLGIYRTLIDALHSGVTVIVKVLRGDLRGAWASFKVVPWLWILSLATGILTVVFLGAGPLTHLIEHYPVQLAGLFCGLIAASVIICWRQLENSRHHHYAVAALSAVITFIGLGLSPAGSDEATVTAPIWVFFIAGAVAITAMILPGISGSFLLLLMGLYAQVLGAVRDRNILVIVVFALGCATGIAVSSTTLRWLLERYHDIVLAAMIGLMIGSIRILWPWPGGFTTAALGLPEDGELVMPVLLAILGLTVVLGLDHLATRLSGQADVLGAEVSGSRPR